MPRPTETPQDLLAQFDRLQTRLPALWDRVEGFDPRGTVQAPNLIYSRNALRNVPEFQTQSYEYYRTYPYLAAQWWLDE